MSALYYRPLKRRLKITVYLIAIRIIRLSQVIDVRIE